MRLSKMSFLEQLNSNDVPKAENITQQMISANKDAATVIFGLLFEFKYGVGPETREFDENSVLTKGVLNWSLVEKGREEFYKLKYPTYFESIKNNDNGLLNKNPMAMQQNGGDGNIYNASFTPIELAKAGSNIVRQYFGGFYMEIFPDSQGQEMKCVIYNDVNLKSLVLHYLQINELTGKEIFPEKYPRINGQTTPLGETKQILKWSENIDVKRFEKYIYKK